MQFPQQKKIYHLHIPKTGGTTLNMYLGAFFDEDRTLASSYWNELRDPMKKAGTWKGFQSFPFEKLFDEHDFVPTHMNLTAYVPEAFVKVCILRNPIDRVASHYADWKRLRPEDLENNPPAVREEKLLVHKLSLAQMCDQAQFDPSRRFFRNAVCKSFLGENVAKHILNDRELYDQDRLFYEAMEVFETFDHVLFLDRLDQQLPELLRSVGIHVENIDLPHLNDNRSASKEAFDSLSQKEKDVVLAHHQADQKLYDYARNESRFRVT